MSQRYLLASLEPLEFTSKPKLSAVRLIEPFRLNLCAKSEKNFEKLQFLIDIGNLLQDLSDAKIDARGSCNMQSFKKRIKNGQAPQVVLDFFQKYPSDRAKIKHFSELLCNTYASTEKNSSGFVSEYCAAEKKLLAFLAAYRVSKTSRSMAKELYFEDTGDLSIAPFIRQGSNFSAPAEYVELFENLESLDKDPLEEYKAVAKYRFELYYDRVKDFGRIGDSVLAYFVCLIILEDMAFLNKKSGIETIKRLVECESEE